MKRKILLPTDFSDNAWSATIYALKLYADEECSFYFLNSVTIAGAPFEDLSSKLLKTLEEDAMKELLELKALAESGNTNSNHDFDIIISIEHLNKAIKDTIKKHDIDLIIMGTKGQQHRSFSLGAILFALLII